MLIRLINHSIRVKPRFNRFAVVAAFSTTRIFNMPKKKIIICCDGTWQSSVTSEENVPSNITRLARHFACNSEDDEWSQVVFYDSGVGTGDIGLQATIQGSSGAGLDTNVIEAYNFIVLNYNKGDKIYCFGFSRGAFTARSVAGLVTDIGIVSPRDMQDFPKLYRAYQENKGGDEFRKKPAYYDWVQGVAADAKSSNITCDFLSVNDAAQSDLRECNWAQFPHGLIDQETRFVEVVGVFDTVGSLGIPDIRGIRLSNNEKVSFHNVKLSPFIKNAFHALALDERRSPFSPTLWYIPYGRKKKQDAATVDPTDFEAKHGVATTREEKLACFASHLEKLDADTLKGTKQLLYQVWFPGVHINIGGGNNAILKNKQGDLEQISNMTFMWMAELLRPHLKMDTKAMDLFQQSRHEALERAKLVKNYGTGAAYYANSAMEALGLKTIPKFKIDTVVEEGWATGDLVDSYGGVMVIAGPKTRTPGACCEATGDMEPLALKGNTREFIHPCVKYRQEFYEKKEPPYLLRALAGFENRKRENTTVDNVCWEWVKKEGGKVWDPNAGKDGAMVSGPIVIPEWIIYPSKVLEFGDKSFERTCLTPDADKWLDKDRDPTFRTTSWWKDIKGEKHEANSNT